MSRRLFPRLFRNHLRNAHFPLPRPLAVIRRTRPSPPPLSRTTELSSPARSLSPCPEIPSLPKRTPRWSVSSPGWAGMMPPGKGAAPSLPPRTGPSAASSVRASQRTGAPFSSTFSFPKERYAIPFPVTEALFPPFPLNCRSPNQSFFGPQTLSADLFCLSSAPFRRFAPFS